MHVSAYKKLHNTQMQFFRLPTTETIPKQSIPGNELAPFFVNFVRYHHLTWKVWLALLGIYIIILIESFSLCR